MHLSITIYLKTTMDFLGPRINILHTKNLSFLSSATISYDKSYMMSMPNAFLIHSMR